MGDGPLLEKRLSLIPVKKDGNVDVTVEQSAPCLNVVFCMEALSVVVACVKNMLAVKLVLIFQDKLSVS